MLKGDCDSAVGSRGSSGAEAPQTGGCLRILERFLEQRGPVRAEGQARG